MKILYIYLIKHKNIKKIIILFTVFAIIGLTGCLKKSDESFDAKNTENKESIETQAKTKESKDEENKNDSIYSLEITEEVTNTIEKIKKDEKLKEFIPEGADLVYAKELDFNSNKINAKDFYTFLIIYKTEINYCDDKEKVNKMFGCKGQEEYLKVIDFDNITQEFKEVLNQPLVRLGSEYDSYVDVKIIKDNEKDLDVIKIDANVFDPDFNFEDVEIPEGEHWKGLGFQRHKYSFGVKRNELLGKLEDNSFTDSYKQSAVILKEDSDNNQMFSIYLVDTNNNSIEITDFPKYYNSSIDIFRPTNRLHKRFNIKDNYLYYISDKNELSRLNLFTNKKESVEIALFSEDPQIYDYVFINDHLIYLTHTHDWTSLNIYIRDVVNRFNSSSTKLVGHKYYQQPYEGVHILDIDPDKNKINLSLWGGFHCQARAVLSEIDIETGIETIIEDRMLYMGDCMDKEPEEVGDDLTLEEKQENELYYKLSDKIDKIMLDDYENKKKCLSEIGFKKDQMSQFTNYNFIGCTNN